MSKEINKDGYRLAHTMITSKRTWKRLLIFIVKPLGMKILRKTDYPDGQFYQCIYRLWS